MADEEDQVEEVEVGGEEVDEWGRPIPVDNWARLANPNYYSQPRRYAQTDIGIGGFFTHLIEVIILFLRGDDRAGMFAQAYGLSDNSWQGLMNGLSAASTAQQNGATVSGSIDAALRVLVDNNAEALLSLIRDAEARDPATGKASYNIANGGRIVNFTGMTIAEVREWQNTTEHPVGSNGAKMTGAAGAYQIMPGTMSDAIKYANMDGGPKITESTIFDEATQDRLARGLLKRRGIEDFRAGRIDGTQFLKNLADEWAGLPMANGLSAYHGIQGNQATTTLDDIQSRAREAAKPAADRRSSSLSGVHRDAVDPAADIVGKPQETFANNAEQVGGTYGAPRHNAVKPLENTPELTGPRVA
jgi:muramidase (phage lysozyme)